MTERDIQSQILIALSARGNKTFRANVGKVKTADGRWFDTGLPKGHSDIYGVKPGGQVFYIEVKKSAEAKRSDEQKRFLEEMKKQGALCGFAWNVQMAIEIVEA